MGRRKIRIALVGCGRISVKHLTAIAHYNERCQLEAIVDNSRLALEKCLSTWSALQHDKPEASLGIPNTYLSYDVFLESVVNSEIGIDLVVIATPSGLHPSQVISAAKAGINVCTEKPMATRWQDGLNMVRSCDEAGVQLFVVKQNRYNPTVKLLKKQIERGRLGRIGMVAVNVFWQRPQSYYDQAAWRGTWEFDGGALMNQASHYVDLLDWLIGPVNHVSSSLASFGRKIEVEDSAVLQLQWRNGAIGTMAVTMLSYPKNIEGSITILGETGSVRLGGEALNKIERWDFKDEHPDDDIAKEMSYEITSVYGMGHIPYYKNMIDTLDGVDLADCDGRQGLRSLELIVAAYRSARHQRAIYLPLEY